MESYELIVCHRDDDLFSDPPIKFEHVNAEDVGEVAAWLMRKLSPDGQILITRHVTEETD
jgi:hypothetical protein